MVAAFAFAAVTGAAELASITIAVLDATFALTTVFEFDAGAVSAGVSAEVVCKTEIFPVSAGIARNNAESIKTVAAPIVIFDKIVCAPRG